MTDYQAPGPLQQAVWDLERAERRVFAFAFHQLVEQHRDERALILEPCTHDGHSHVELTAVEHTSGTFQSVQDDHDLTPHLTLELLTKERTTGVYDLETDEWRVDVAIYLAAADDDGTVSEMAAWV